MRHASIYFAAVATLILAFSLPPNLEAYLNLQTPSVFLPIPRPSPLSNPRNSSLASTAFNSTFSTFLLPTSSSTSPSLISALLYISAAYLSLPPNLTLFAVDDVRLSFKSSNFRPKLAEPKRQCARPLLR